MPNIRFTIFNFRGAGNRVPPPKIQVRHYRRTRRKCQDTLAIEPKNSVRSAFLPKRHRWQGVSGGGGCGPLLAFSLFSPAIIDNRLKTEPLGQLGGNKANNDAADQDFKPDVHCRRGDLFSKCGGMEFRNQPVKRQGFFEYVFHHFRVDFRFLRPDAQHPPSQSIGGLIHKYRRGRVADPRPQEGHRLVGFEQGGDGPGKGHLNPHQRQVRYEHANGQPPRYPFGRIVSVQDAIPDKAQYWPQANQEYQQRCRLL